MTHDEHRAAPQDAILRRRSPRGAAASDGGASRAAVLVIDMQNDFCHPDGRFATARGWRIEGVGELVERIDRLVGAARDAGVAVIWTRMVWDSDEEVGLLRHGGILAREGLRRGTWGAEIVDELDVRADDPVVDKKRFSAFFRTGLESLLASRGIRRLYVAGVRTDYCVESTVRDAFFRDLDVVVVRDCVAGFFETLHRNSLAEMATVFAEVVDCDVAVERLRGESAAPAVVGAGDGRAEAARER